MGDGGAGGDDPDRGDEGRPAQEGIGLRVDGVGKGADGERGGSGDEGEADDEGRAPGRVAAGSGRGVKGPPP